MQHETNNDEGEQLEGLSSCDAVMLPFANKKSRKTDDIQIVIN